MRVLLREANSCVSANGHQVWQTLPSLARSSTRAVKLSGGLCVYIAQSKAAQVAAVSQKSNKASQHSWVTDM